MAVSPDSRTQQARLVELWDEIRTKTAELKAIEQRKQALIERTVGFDVKKELQLLRRQVPSIARHGLSLTTYNHDILHKMLGEKHDCILCHDTTCLAAAAQYKEVYPAAKVILDAIEMPNYADRARKVKDSASKPNSVEVLHEQWFNTWKYCVDLSISVSRSITKSLNASGLPATTIENFREQRHFERDYSIRHDLNLSGNDVLCLWLNNIYPKFGIEGLLNNWANLPETFHFATIGRIVPEKYEQDLRELCNDLAIENRVHFLPFMDYDEFTKYASGADVMITSLDPGVLNNQFSMPNRLFDSIDAGLPIVINRLTDIEAFVKEHGIGAIYEYDDWGTMKDALNHVLGNLETFRERVAEAKTTASFEVLEDRVLAILGEYERIAFLGTRDVSNNKRVLRLARFLKKHGKEITIYGPEAPIEVHEGISYVRAEGVSVNPTLSRH